MAKLSASHQMNISFFFTMAKYPDKTFTRDELITISLGENFNGYDRTIDTHIKNSKAKN